MMQAPCPRIRATELLCAALLLALGASTAYAAEGDFVWARGMGGTGNDEGISIAVDSAGNVYTTGSFQDTADFNPGAGIYLLNSAGTSDIFVSKLDANGNFLWARVMGGTGINRGNSVAVDNAGSVYTTGSFSETADFDPGAATYLLTSAGSADIFVSKLDNNGNFLWAHGMGGTSGDGGYSIAVDSAGNVHTTGSFQSTVDFDPGAGVSILTSVGASDIFVSKLDNNGNFLWARGMGGTDYDNGHSIAVDSAGNVYTTGWFARTADFDPGAATYPLTSVSYTDIYVSKLDVNGNFVWARDIGGIGFDGGYSIAVDSAGNVYITGSFSETADFDPGAATYLLTSAGSADIFVSKLDSDGNFLWAHGMGGSDNVTGYSIAVDSVGNVYTTGWFAGTVDFDPGSGVSILTSVGASDIFVTKLDMDGNFLWARGMGGTDYDNGHSIALDSAGNLYTTGYFQGTADFDPGAGAFLLTEVGGGGIFVFKLSGGCGIGALHLADINNDGIISLSELLRIIQFYHLGSITCLAGSEDGYFAGDNGDTTCTLHSGDYNPQDWSISFEELIRMIQLYNSFQYCPCPGVGEDGFCTG